MKEERGGFGLEMKGNFKLRKGCEGRRGVDRCRTLSLTHMKHFYLEEISYQKHLLWVVLSIQMTVFVCVCVTHLSVCEYVNVKEYFVSIFACALMFVSLDLSGRCV